MPHSINIRVYLYDCLESIKNNQSDKQSFNTILAIDYP